MFRIVLMAAAIGATDVRSIGVGIFPAPFDTLEACEQARASQSFADFKRKLADDGAERLKAEIWQVDRCVEVHPGQPVHDAQ